MEIEILYFDGCPTYSEAGKTLGAILARENAEAEADVVAIYTGEGARRPHHPG